MFGNEAINSLEPAWSNLSRSQSVAKHTLAETNPADGVGACTAILSKESYLAFVGDPEVDAHFLPDRTAIPIEGLFFSKVTSSGNPFESL